MVDNKSQSADATLRLLLVEDDPRVARFVGKVAESEGWATTHAPSVAVALEEARGDSFNLVLLDDKLPDGYGSQAFPQLRSACPSAAIIMITGFPDLQTAVELTRRGLFDYLIKPVELPALTSCLRQLRTQAQQPGASVGLNHFAGESIGVRHVREQLAQAAQYSAATVLLRGETGVGKDLAARIIHALTVGENAHIPMVSLDCGAVPETLFEAELFGVEKGAFTGADRKREGLAKLAQGGTLFLDEVGEIPLALQAKLLRFLENREYRPLGGKETASFTGRVVAATNRDLKAEARAGRFRSDLLYRLDVFNITIPPLRERADDLPRIVDALLGQLAEKYGRSKPMVADTELNHLRAYDFPGNVRELRNILERALIQTPREVSWLKLEPLVPNQSRNAPGANASTDVAEFARQSGMSILDAQEYLVLKEALQQEGGVLSQVARRLGITRQAVQRRVEKWPDLRPPSDAGGTSAQNGV